MIAVRTLRGASRSAYVIVGLHLLAGAGVFAVVSGPGRTTVANYAALALTAYALGLRHAFDADHIAAIDATTRRLLALGRPARGVGLWFSTGHSTVVVGLCAALLAGSRAVSPLLVRPDSQLHRATDLIGPVVSGVVVVGLACLNLALLARRSRPSHPPAQPGGLIWPWIGKLSWAIDRPPRMYFVGVAFGLGFDTATEIGLLASAASVAIGEAGWVAVMTLPLVFAAGMSLLDSAQGAMARSSYAQGTAFRSGNIALTGLSAGVALLVGVTELAGIASDHVHALAWLPTVNTEFLGFGLTGVLLLALGVFALRRRRRLAD